MSNQPNLYIIAGCNGAGKTTASFVVLPELLGCREFINADEIAKGISPFNPESVAITSGKIMLERIHFLLEEEVDFGFETTLSSKGLVEIITKAKQFNYRICIVVFWLNTVQLALDRVAERVSEGGHNISNETITRRYARGIRNFKNTYQELVNSWLIIDNSNTHFEIISKFNDGQLTIYNENLFQAFKNQ
ncbi:MAG: zeta toxin family protein [Saprospiraceae bacterium]|uniref:Zeta toxin family protein n=1 Tax=Candidatus Opimibacter skivensis TaxID=2982028 RepID=A0A9D7STK7_9BACT|nr:zeta toxin family protein [Candidatus Opimibacter skivensis]